MANRQDYYKRLENYKEKLKRSFPRKRVRSVDYRYPGYWFYDTEQTYKILVQLMRFHVYERNRMGLNLTPELQTNVADVAEWLVNGENSCLILFGNLGNGKTTLMEAVDDMLSMQNYQQIITSAQNLCTFYSDHLGQMGDIYDLPILCLDDLGSEDSDIIIKGARINPIVGLINQRVSSQRGIIITTNLSREGILEKYGSRISERFTEESTWIPFNEGSFRASIAEIKKNLQKENTKTKNDDNDKPIRP